MFPFLIDFFVVIFHKFHFSFSFWTETKAREMELAMWRRRATYDPMKAAAEGRKKQEEAKKISQKSTKYGDRCVFVQCSPIIFCIQHSLSKEKISYFKITWHYIHFVRNSRKINNQRMTTISIQPIIISFPLILFLEETNNE